MACSVRTSSSICKITSQHAKNKSRWASDAILGGQGCNVMPKSKQLAGGQAKGGLLCAHLLLHPYCAHLTPKCHKSTKEKWEGPACSVRTASLYNDSSSERCTSLRRALSAQQLLAIQTHTDTEATHVQDAVLVGALNEGHNALAAGLDALAPVLLHTQKRG